MSTRLLLLVSVLVCTGAAPLQAMESADPLLASIQFSKLEAGVAEDPVPQRVEARAWAGYDLDKLWLRSDVERSGGHTEAADLEVLYGRAITPFWDMVAGWKHDFEPSPDRDWLAVGFQGLAPYMFEVEATAYVNADGDTALDVMLEYEMMLTQRLVLSPEVEFVVNGYDDAATGAGSGLAKVEAGLRLRYEVRREFAPYIGIHWERAYGDSADFAREEGEAVDDIYAVIGIRAWY